MFFPEEFEEEASFLEELFSVVDQAEASNDTITKVEMEDSQSQYDKSSLAYWGLPQAVCDAYKDEGIESLYPWQIECLEQDNVLHGQNLVYSAPTSSGKSLVAEILMLRQILSTKKRAIMILPFISVVAEKEKFMKRVYSSLGLLIEGYYANKGGQSLLDHEEDELNIAICTIEKANSLLNRAVEEGKIEEFGIIVIDEIHMMGDSGRGYILELLVTKMLYLQLSNLQIVGLSATLPNISIFNDWLHASIYITEYRPVPLSEYIKIGDTIYDSSMKEVRKLAAPVSKDSEQIVDLCCETLLEHNSVLIFCSSKRNAEKLCGRLASLLPDEVLQLMNQSLDGSQILNIITALKRTPGGLDPVLESSVPSFVAYHHSGLTIEEREIIENGFRSGIIKILTATSTLAAGVNLPARRVIFQTPFIGIDFIDATRYKQMAGRAGRKGIDTKGESFLLCKKNQKQKILSNVLCQLLPLESCLIENRRGMVRPLMDIIASGVVETIPDVERYIMNTLFAKQKHYTEVHKVSKKALRFLEENDFVNWLVEKNKFQPTKLGKATVASALSPEEGFVVFQELKKARQQMILNTDLHIVYEVTPIYHNISPDWDMYLTHYSSLDPDSMRVADLVGVREEFLVQSTHQRPRSNSSETAIHTRFFAALILHDLIKEVSIQNVSQHYRTPRGHLQSLQTTAATFCGMVTVFCQQLKWWSLHSLIGNFSDRLCFGVEPDIIPLAQIPHVKGHRARILFKKGYKTVASIAKALPSEIEEIFQIDAPYKHVDDEDSKQARKAESRVARLIVCGAQQILGTQSDHMARSASKFRSYPPSTRKESPKFQKKFYNHSLRSPRNMSPRNLSLTRSPKRSKNSVLVRNSPLSKTSSFPPQLLSKTTALLPMRVVSTTSMKESYSVSPVTTPANFPKQLDSAGLPKQVTSAGLPVVGEENRTNLPLHPLIPLAQKRDNTFPPHHSPIPFPIPQVIHDPPVKQKAQIHGKAPLVMKKIIPHPLPLKSAPLKLPLKLVSPSLPLPLTLRQSPSLALRKELAPKLTKTITKVDHHPVKKGNAADKGIAGALLPTKQVTGAGGVGNKKKTLLPLLPPPTTTKAFLLPLQKGKKAALPPPPPPSKAQKATNKVKTTKTTTLKNTPSVYLSSVPCEEPLPRPRLIPNYSPKSPQSTPSPPSSPAVLREIGCVHPSSSSFPFVIVTVNDNFKSYETLLHLWSQQPHFAFSLLTSIQGSEDYKNNNDEWHSSGALKSNIPSMALAEPEIKKFTKKKLKLLDEMPHLTNIDGISVCWNEKQCFFLSLRSLPDGSSSRQLESYRWELIRRVMIHSTAHKTTYEMTEKYQLLLECGIRVHKTLQDPRIAAWVIDPEEKNNGSLDSLAERYIPSKKIIGSSSFPIGKVGKETMQSWLLMNFLLERLKVDILYNPFRDIEMEVVPILAEMQHWGMGFNRVICNDHQTVVHNTLKALERKAHASANREFSLTTPMEVGVVLFNELKLPCSKELTSKRSIKANKPPRKSTSATVLQQIRHLHPLPGIILEHRKLTTWRIKYMNNLPKYAVYNSWLEMDRIHAVQLHTQTPTGRVAVKNPNLQCIPHSLDFLSHGEELSQTNMTISIRDAFVAAKGCVLLSADYSQLEVRLMTHFSQDPLLLSIFRKGGDVFKNLASEWLRKPIQDITAVERSHGKRVCYGMLYGIGPKALGESLEISTEKASAFQDSFKRNFRGVTKYLESAIAEARKKGYIETICGRRRYFPDLKSNDTSVRLAAERCAINTICQGSAADLVKLAMVRIWRRLEADSRIDHSPCHLYKRTTGPQAFASQLASQLPTPNQCTISSSRLLLQIHDELLFEVPRSDLAIVQAIVKEEMETSLEISIPFIVNLQAGKTWGTLKSV